MNQVCLVIALCAIIFPKKKRPCHESGLVQNIHELKYYILQLAAMESLQQWKLHLSSTNAKDLPSDLQHAITNFPAARKVFNEFLKFFGFGSN